MCLYSKVISKLIIGFTANSEGIFGALLNDSSLKADSSTSLRYHPYFEPQEYVEFDYRFQESCCLQDEADCMPYTDLRVKDFGIYKPSRFGELLILLILLDILFVTRLDNEQTNYMYQVLK